jgi:hypothetical protein
VAGASTQSRRKRVPPIDHRQHNRCLPEYIASAHVEKIFVTQLVGLLGHGTLRWPSSCKRLVSLSPADGIFASVLPFPMPKLTTKLRNHTLCEVIIDISSTMVLCRGEWSGRTFYLARFRSLIVEFNQCFDANMSVAIVYAPDQLWHLSEVRMLCVHKLHGSDCG